MDLSTSIDHGVIMWHGSGIYRETFWLVSSDNDFDDGDGYDYDDDNDSWR